MFAILGHGLILFVSALVIVIVILPNCRIFKTGRMAVGSLTRSDTSQVEALEATCPCNIYCNILQL